jgi:hypothetical protein
VDATDTISNIDARVLERGRSGPILCCPLGRANGSLAKLQAGSHAKATRRGSCRANHCF